MLAGVLVAAVGGRTGPTRTGCQKLQLTPLQSRLNLGQTEVYKYDPTDQDHVGNTQFIILIIPYLGQ